MKNYQLLGLLYLCLSLPINAEDDMLHVSLTGKRLQIKISDGSDYFVQTGELLHREADGKYYKNENTETYLIAFWEGRPSIIE